VGSAAVRLRKLLPSGTPEERARLEKSVALAEKLGPFLTAQNVTEGFVIEAVGLMFANRSTSPEQAQKYAADLAAAVLACWQLKEANK
jgi:hypothetical protein